MRKLVIGAAAAVLLLAACADDTPSVGGGTPSQSGSAAATAAACAQQNEGTFVNAGELTIGTDNPAYPPYFAGGETDAHSEWKFNDPYTGKGFEDAVAYEVADRLGFSKDQVQWTVAPFGQTYKPGPRDYDFAIEKIS
jgi:polar amino acid transport system substrate-binding protein